MVLDFTFQLGVVVMVFPKLLSGQASLRTIAFVDAGQFRPAVVNGRLNLAGDRRFDWGMFKRFVDSVAGGSVFDVHYFDSTEPQSLERQSNFHLFLRQQLGFQLHFSPLREKQRRCPCCRRNYMEFEQKGVDVNMTISMLRLADRNAYDQAILCSGDGDFAYLVEYLRDALGKRVVVLGWAAGVALPLREAAYCTLNLNDYANHFIGYRDVRPVSSDVPPVDSLDKSGQIELELRDPVGV